MKTLKTIALVLFIAACFAAAGWIDFHLWRIQHPDAPAWSWLASRK